MKPTPLEFGKHLDVYESAIFGLDGYEQFAVPIHNDPSSRDVEQAPLPAFSHCQGGALRPILPQIVKR
jgi:hypothetical protein